MAQQEYNTSMWPFRKKNPRAYLGGSIGYFKLTDWWLSTFTESEREHIEAIYHPFGNPQSRPLTEGEIISTTGTASGLLHSLATWFQRPNDRLIARRLLTKAEDVAGANVLDRHFTYQGVIQTYYPDRDTDSTALAIAIDACKKQIALAPQAAKAFKLQYPDLPLPTHVGYTQLAILHEKDLQYGEAIRISKQALRHGWAGDWEKRIARCEAKIRKVKGRKI